MRDWFATLRKPQATWATGATAGPMPCDTSLSRFPNVVAQTGNRWATGATSHPAKSSRPTSVAQVARQQGGRATEFDSPGTAEYQDSLESVAQVAQVAQENDKAATAAWDAEDWRVHFEERASIAEHNGGLSRTEAEALAYECCIVAWLNCHAPIQDNLDQCIHCGERMAETEALPFLTGDGGHVWLHSGCHEEWMARRRAGAMAGLAIMGIRQGSGGLFVSPPIVIAECVEVE